jgi:hypothetical protein
MNDTSPEPGTFASLYRRAFVEYGTQATAKVSMMTGVRPRSCSSGFK